MHPARGPLRSALPPGTPLEGQDEEYDAWDPNDYEELLREQRRMHAGAHAAEGSSRASEGWPSEGSSEAGSWERGAGVAGDHAGGERSRGGPGLGARMLAKMGWEVGTGLGRTSSGMLQPLEARKTGRHTGVILMRADAPQREARGEAPQSRGAASGAAAHSGGAAGAAGSGARWVGPGAPAPHAHGAQAPQAHGASAPPQPPLPPPLPPPPSWAPAPAKDEAGAAAAPPLPRRSRWDA